MEPCTKIPKSLDSAEGTSETKKSDKAPNPRSSLQELSLSSYVLVL